MRLTILGLVLGVMACVADGGVVGHSVRGADTVFIDDSAGSEADNVDFSFLLVNYDVQRVANAPFELVLDVSNSSGVNEYDFWGNLINHTGATWGGMRLELWVEVDGVRRRIPSGFDAAPGTPGWQSDTLDPDFDTPHQDSHTTYDSWDPALHTDSEILWTNSVPSGNSATTLYSVDIPDIDSGTFVASGPVDQGYSLIVRHIPIPEPTSVTSLTLVIALLVVRRRTARDM